MSKEKKASDVMKEAADKLPAVMDANTLYKEFIGLTNIERVKEQDYVLKSLMRGKSKNEIVSFLSKKHPDYNFNYYDLEKFMARNQKIVQAMGKEVEMSARRTLEAKEQCSEMLAGLALYTQNLVKEFRSEGDNTNTVAAIRALNGTLENYMKVEGIVDSKSDQPQVVNVVNAVSEGKSRLKDKIHRADFDFDEEDEHVIDGKIKDR